MSDTTLWRAPIPGRNRSANDGQDYLRFGWNALFDRVEAVGIGFAVRAAAGSAPAEAPGPFPFLVTLGSEGGAIAGGEAGSGAGWSVASAGDVNGDGYGDVVIGAPAADGSAGRAWVLFGRGAGIGAVDLGQLTPMQGFAITGAAPGDEAGWSVAGAGDLDGDGFADLAIGARRSDAAGPDAGEIWLSFGHGGPFSSLDLGALAAGEGLRIRGAEAGDFAGASVAAAGDVNGDGFADLIIGAPHAEAGTGAAYLIFGRAGAGPLLDLAALAPDQGFAIGGAGAYAYAGSSVASAGDVNGDGFDDLIVGVPRGAGGGAVTGEAYVIFGHAGPFGTVDLAGLAPGEGFVLTGAAAYDYAGCSVASAGDVNGDGFADLIVGARYADADEAEGDTIGKAYVVFGHAGPFAAVALGALAPGQGFEIRGEAGFVQAGLSVASAGDLNGDGFDDLLVGAPYAGEGHRGRFYLIFGSGAGFGTIALDALTPAQGFVVEGPADGALAGWSVASAGDVDGDGYDDLIVGAPGIPGTARDAGAAYILYGHATEAPPPGPPTLDLNGAQAGTGFAAAFVEGGAAAAIGQDIAVTAPGAPIVSATITITDAVDGDALVLAGALPAAIAVQSGLGTGRLVLAGTGPPGDWAAALALVRFANAGANPNSFGTDATRTIDVVVSDGPVSSATATTIVTIAAVNDAPSVTTSAGTRAYAESVDAPPAALAVDPGLTIADPDDGALAGATVTIGAGFQPGEDLLAFANSDAAAFGDISASYSAGVLMLSSAGGTATLAQWQAALRAVTYANSAEAPSEAIRTIAFAVHDGGAWSDVATRPLSVTAQNDSPAGTDATLAIPEDAVFTFAAAHFGFSDLDGDAFAGVRFGVAPTGGTLFFDADGGGPTAPVAIAAFPTAAYTAADIAAGRLRFVPDANLNGAGAASIGFTVIDDGGTAGAGRNEGAVPTTLRFDINPVNDPPAANDDGDSATEDGPARFGNVGANDSDVDDGATRSYALNASAPPGLTFNPDGSYGFDPSNAAYQHLAVGISRIVAVTYIVTDDHGATATATLTIVVTGANDAPVAEDDSDSATEDGALVTGSVAGNDRDADDDATRSYALDAPVAGLTLDSDGSYSFDPSNPAYQPLAQGAARVVVATYRVTDDQGAADIATLTITVTGANDAPAAADDAAATREDEALAFDSSALTANDGDADEGDGLSVTAVGNAVGGAVVLGADGTISFTPDADFNGLAAFDYWLSDGRGGVATATVTVTVSAVNDAPGGTDKSVSLLEDHGYAFTAADFGFADPAEDHKLAAVIIAALPAAGTLTLNGHSVAAGQSIALADLAGLRFTPAANGNGDDYASLAFQVQDDGGTANGGQDIDPIPNLVRFDVMAIDDAPVITGAMAGDVVEPGGVDDEEPGRPSATGNLDFSDVDNSEDVWQAVTAGADSLFGFGSYGVTAAGDWTYVLKKTHAAVQALDGAAALTDMFTMLTADGTGQIVTVTIHGQNDAPVNSVPGAQTLLEDGSKIFSGANGNAISVADVDAASLTVTLSVAHGALTLSGTSGLTISAGANGSATMTLNGSAAAINAALDGLAYVPAADYEGADSLQVSTSDGSLTDTDSIGLSIGAVNDAPTVSIGDGSGTVFAGDTFQVGTGPAQAFPSGEVTALADGGFAIVWTSNGLAGPYHAQNYDAAGAAVGPEAEIKGYVVVALEGGGFVALWRPFGPDGDGRGILAQRYDESWNEVGAEFVVNSVTAGAQDNPAAAALDGGGFVVTWTSPDGSGDGIFAQRYDETGSRAGGQFRVNTATANSQGIPKVEALPGGGFVVIWITGQSLANGGPDVFGQRYDAAGAAIGAEFRVNTLTAGIQFNPAVAVLEDGGFVVVWEGLAPDGAGGISGRRYDAAGNALGTEFRISAPNDLFQQAPDVTALAEGGFVVTWDTNGPGDGDNIFALCFDSAGRPVGTEFRVDTVTESVGGPSIAGLADGGFAIAWTSDGDTVHGRRMEPVFQAVEQVALDLKGEILLGDVDAGTGTIGVTLTVASGILHVLPGTSGASVSGDGSASVTITGTLAQVNALLGTDAGSVVTFTADSDAPPASTNLSVAISDNGNSGDGGVLTAIATQTIAIQSVNDAPVNSVPGAQTTNEDTSFTLSAANGNAISVADVDSTTLTVTLSAGHGTLTLASVAGLSFSGGSDGTNDVAMTFSGTAAAINAALESGLTYNPAANHNGQDAISLTTTDGAGGGAQTDSDSIFVTINPVNDQPFGADKTITLNEDGSYSIAVADFGFSDPVEGNAFLAVFVNGVPNQGELRLNGNLVVSGQTIMVTDIAAGGLIFTPAANQFGQAYGQFSYQVMDDGGGANFAVMSRKITFDVAPVNDAPVNSVPGAQAIDEDGSFTLSAANANAISVADVDATTLTVTLAVQHGTLTLASITGLSFGTGDGTADPTMTFTGTAAAINAALGAGVTYDPTANYNGPDAISLTTTDNGQSGIGGIRTDTDSVAIAVASVNDAPSGTDAARTISEDGSHTFVAADFGFGDADGGVLLNLIFASAPSNGQLRLDGVALTAFPATVGASDIAAGRLSFHPNANANGAGYASFTFQVQDNGGTADGGQNTDQSPNSFTFNVTAVNDIPALDLDGLTAGRDFVAAYTENAAPVLIAPNALVSDLDSADFAGGQLGVFFAANGASGDFFSILSTGNGPGQISISGGNVLYGGVVIASGTNGSGSLILNLTANATPAAIQALLRQVTIVSTRDSFAAASWTVAIELNDGDGNLFVPGSAFAGGVIDIIAVDDAPIAQPDAFAVTETGTIASGNLFANDADVDGPALAVSAVNGSAANVGNQIVLASGALLTVNANGIFSYNPNGTFRSTPAPGSGASNAVAQDSFSYTLAGGNIAMVAIAVTGLDSDGDILIGSNGDDSLNGGAGADRMIGGAGGDSYFLDSVGDVVIEHANEGYDIIYAGVSYALAADSFVEVLATIDNNATTAINLTGNALANYLVGNAGSNLLDGGAGPDQLWGRGGDDSYYADAGDDVVEYDGDGYDILYARSSYGLGVGQSIEVLATIDNTATTAINLIGNALSNYIVGNAGSNTLNGGGGDDQLWGREGDDSYIADMNDIVLEYAGQGNDILYATASYILAAGLSIETLATADNTATTAIDLYGNELDNYVTGNAGANTLDGGTGSDLLWGRGGDDSYFADGNDVVLENAGQGTDIIYARGSFVLGAGVSVEVLGTVDNTLTTALNLTGNELANYVTGNAGANILNGGAGADQLFGRGGADTFAFTTALGGGNVDQILDFVSGTDRIALDDATFSGIGTPGNFNPNAFFAGNAAHDADDRIVYNAATGQLFYDADGSGAGAAVLFAVITGAPVIAASDFAVI